MPRACSITSNASEILPSASTVASSTPSGRVWAASGESMAQTLRRRRRRRRAGSGDVDVHVVAVQQDVLVAGASGDLVRAPALVGAASGPDALVQDHPLPPQVRRPPHPAAPQRP